MFKFAVQLTIQFAVPVLTTLFTVAAIIAGTDWLVSFLLITISLHAWIRAADDRKIRRLEEKLEAAQLELPSWDRMHELAHEVQTLRRELRLKERRAEDAAQAKWRIQILERDLDRHRERIDRQLLEYRQLHEYVSELEHRLAADEQAAA